MGRYSFTLRRAIVTVVATFAASLVVTVSGAQAIVVTDNGVEAGVALVPSVRGSGLPSGITAVTSSSSCTDPWLAGDLGGPAMPSTGLCYRGGSVIHKNETFALTWDNYRAYWSVTRGYVEQFLRDVADSAGSLATPYALTPQYSDGSGRALDASVFGGGCIDYGISGGSSCEFGSPTGAGHDFPASGCTSQGDSFTGMSSVLYNSTCLTDAQLQSEIATMVAQTGILSRTQPGHTPLVSLLLPPGVDTCLDPAGTLCSINHYLTPPPPKVSAVQGGSLPIGNYRVEITYVTASGEQVPSASQPVTTTSDVSATDATIYIQSPPAATGATAWYAYITAPNGFTYSRAGGPAAIGTPITVSTLPSGGIPPSQPAYCSYHSQVNVGGTEVAYVVQPWSAGTGCDEPDAPKIPDNPSPQQLSVAIGQRLVSPLSQSHIAAIVNPAFTGWVNKSGTEINDNPDNYGNPCQPEGNGNDTVTVGSSSQNPYYLQREYDNGATLAFDPFTYFGCAPVVNLAPNFVAPSAVDQGDEVQFDGSATATTLDIPNAGYSWSFGDGSAPAVGASVVHSFGSAGTYTVTLNVTDRGGNKSSFSQNVIVLTANGQQAPPPGGGGSGSGSGSGSGGSGSSGGGVAPFQVHLLLLPEGLRSVLSRGLFLRVSANQVANGLITVSISRKAARRAHIAVGRWPSVVIGRGTVSQVSKGVVVLDLHLSPRMAAKLRHLRHLTVTVRLALVPAVGRSLAVVVAGRY